MYGWIREGGWLLLAVEAGDEPGVVSEWLGQPMFFSHFGVTPFPLTPEG